MLLRKVLHILDPSGLLPVALYGDENGEFSYDSLVWESTEVRKPTKEEFDAAVEQARLSSYQEARQLSYPSIEDQLDLLFHQGYDGWKSAVQSIKDKYPKPEGLASS